MSRDPAYSDDVLLRALQGGDGEALGALYDRYAGWVLALALRILQSRPAAEDLVHDVFLELWQASGDYDPSRGSVRTWLLLRARSRAIDRVRAVRRQPWTLHDPAVLRAGAPSEVFPDAERVRRAVLELPAPVRDVLLLAYFGGLSSVEIATQLAIPAGTVKSRLRRGRELLGSSLSDAGSQRP